MGFAAYINKSPSQELTLRSESREYSYSLPSRKEEDESQGDLGGERLICASLDEPLPPETAQDCTKTPDALHRALFYYMWPFKQV